MAKRFVVIGAGPAGLTAAYQILRDISRTAVDVYEAEERAGGISATIEYRGNRIDIGGHRFFSKSRAVNDFWLSLMPLQSGGAKDDIILGKKKKLPVQGPDPEREDAVMLLRDRVSRIFYRRRFFDYPVSLKPETFLNMGLFNTILAGFSFLYSSVKKRKENSLEDFYINRFGRHLYRLFFEDYTEKVWGIHPAQLSPSWGAQRVKELSVGAVIKEALVKIINPHHKTKQTSLIEQFYYPKMGPGQLWSLAAEKITQMGGRIHYNRRVSGIHIENGSVAAITAAGTEGDTTISCDVLLSTMPVKDLVEALRSAGQEQVPDRIFCAARSLPYRDFITVGLLLKKLKIPNRTKIKTLQNIVPDCWIYIQERDVRIGRLQIFNNWSPYMVRDAEHTVWIGLEYFCNEGDELWNLSSGDFIEFAAAELAKINIIDRDDVLDATQVKIRKAYPAYFGSYGEMGGIRKYLDAISNLYCLGRNGQHKYNNMDHSMLTAMEAVKLIKSGGLDKSSVWNVNEGEEYHEER
ncbi:MAG: NAD(P)/FAD-dependent oxidoreductase [Treponema sp.]|jgi:protoporphyrinogen oxidase|nr:NAD(P)/FAD-dependent oxidoreductase [Treponema sp.]